MTTITDPTGHANSTSIHWRHLLIAGNVGVAAIAGLSVVVHTAVDDTDSPSTPATFSLTSPAELNRAAVAKDLAAITDPVELNRAHTLSEL